MTLMKNDSTVKNRKDKKKYNMYSLRRKRVPGNLTREPRLVLKEIKRCSMPNGTSGVVCLVQDPIQLHCTVRKRSQRFPVPKKARNQVYVNLIQGGSQAPSKAAS